jgi:hypothetical protein
MEHTFLMKTSRLLMYGMSVLAGAGILAGCSGNAMQSTPSGLTPAGSAARQMVHMSPLAAANGVMHTVSQPHSDWVRPDKKKKGSSLLYISDYGSNVVYFYDYTPGKIGKQAGEITSGISGPQGLCTDKKGDVWVSNTNDTQELEYASGSTKQKTSLTTTGYYPADCAVSKKGDLAVTGICNSASCGQGALLIFTTAKGTPKTYTCGNLYVDGENASGGFGLCELAAGGKTLTDVTVSSPPEFPGGVQWDGKYVSIVDQEGAQAIQYSVSGGSATEKGTVPLNGAGDVVQDTINAGYLIGPDAANAAVEIWKYPAGGSPVDTQSGLSEPIGSAVSTTK